MAGINRIYVKWHSDKVDLVYWVIKNKPSYLHKLILPFENYDDWIRCQQDYAKMRGIALIPENEDEIDNIKLPVASFNTKEDRYLYWHCPLEFVREYLETQCGYKKANWFVKLFWKY